ncbi:MAG: cytidylate kinase family protein [Candidatus Promineifilaceae bacterium]|nr:cytidylate kinase family protein [Candidatus Promineifilaceae bacterium]
MIDVIALSGEVASGKSSLAEALAEQLPRWERINTGARFREFCRERGMSIQEVATVDDAVHRAFDRDQQELMRSGGQIIIEGRLAGWLAQDLENVFRVFCSAGLETRIERYMQRHKVTAEQARIDIEHRDTGDINKFRHIYHVADYRDANYYDLLLDTSQLSPPELAQVVVSAARLS